MTRTITAYFDTRSEADAAAARLAEAGYNRDSVAVHAASSGELASSASSDADSSEGKSLFESIGDFFMPDEDRYAYQEGLRRGGAVLTVSAADADFDRVSDLLEEAGSVDLDTREREWRSQGWSGYDASTARTATAATSAGSASADAAGASTALAGGRGKALRDDDTIDVVEEQLRVGKREVDHGRVRIRSYVVETPVQENVSLRSESVHVERRPVDRAVTDADRPVFEDRILEAEESREEAVVSKQARVVEEIGLTRNVQDRVETVSDTVRRTEVEIEDERTNNGVAGGVVTDNVVTDEERARQRR